MNKFIVLTPVLISATFWGCQSGPATEPIPAIDAVGEWRQWRGPTGMGISREIDLPESWAPDSANIRWRVEAPGLGNSSPITSQGRLFVTAVRPQEGQPDQLQRVVAAYDLQTGQGLWQTVLFTGPKGKVHSLNTAAAPTPTTDGKDVFVYFGPVAARLDWDGRVVWQRQVEEGYFEHTRYGAGSSPILVGETLLLFQDKEYADNDDRGWMAALNKATGEELWRRYWDDTCCSYSTPLLLEKNGATRLFFPHTGALVEYDPATGERLWGEPIHMIQPVPTPVFADGVLCVAGGEIKKRSVKCLRIPEDGRQGNPEVLWETLHFVPKTSSPVLYNGLLFTVSPEGVMACYDPMSGELHWKSRLEGGRNFHSSLLAGDGKVYATGRGGYTVVVAAESRFRLISVNDVGGRIGSATPILADGCLVLRTEEHLVCIEKETEET